HPLTHHSFPTRRSSDLVPVEAEPAQGVLDLLGRLRDLAAGVGVLDAKAELAAMMAREEPVEERGPNVPDVQKTSGAGRHANANRSEEHTSELQSPYDLV